MSFLASLIVAAASSALLFSASSSSGMCCNALIRTRREASSSRVDPGIGNGYQSKSPLRGSLLPSRTRTARDQSVPIFAKPSSVSWYLYSLIWILESESGTHTSNPRFILVSWVPTDANTELTVSVPAFSSLSLLLSSESRLENSTSIIWIPPGPSGHYRGFTILCPYRPVHRSSRAGRFWPVLALVIGLE